MKWLINFFGSSIGRKLLMSLTGLFLILFLVVHLIGNLQLLKGDGGEAFNTYAKFMTSNPLIKIVGYGNYFFILLHAVVGLMLWAANRKAKGQKYAVSPKTDVTWASKNMALLGTLILAFIFIHMGDFWFKMKFGEMGTVTYASEAAPIKDLYARVATAFSQPLIVFAYLIGMFVLSFHLWHGFQSAFQTLGFNHRKYTPTIHLVGKAFAIVVPALFALIPIYFYFFMRS
jgi:succinate dehydrogenase / fumarate reductase, cytochrome b subunit